MSRRPPLNAATIAAILRRLTPDERALLDRLRAASNKSVIEYWQWKLGSGWGFWVERASPEWPVWVAAARHWDDLGREQDADEVSAETDRLEAAESMARIDAAMNVPDPAPAPTPKHSALDVKLVGQELDDRAVVDNILQLMDGGMSRAEAIDRSYPGAQRSGKEVPDKQVKDRLRGKVTRELARRTAAGLAAR
jgi:hypothetical protein